MRCDCLALSDGLTAADNLSVVQGAVQGGEAAVGVGLAGSLLLGLGDLPDGAAGARLLALFPHLGVNPDPYGAGGWSPVWPDRWLRLARLLLRWTMARVALTPAPRGLDGIFARHRLSWCAAAAALRSTDFASLIVASRPPVTVVLKRASPELRRERAGLAFSALNASVSLRFADPAGAGAQLAAWSALRRRAGGRACLS